MPLLPAAAWWIRQTAPPGTPDLKVLLTGGAGFIGSHLARLVVEQGHSVTVLDDLSTGKRQNLAPLEGQVQLIVGDVADPAAQEEALAGKDAFVHLAAVASVEASVRDPLGTHRTNLEASIGLFDTAARLGVKRALYASSAAVYGDNPDLPLTEAATKRPLSPYAADKLAGEHYLAYYHRAGRLDATAFRFFNVFGPRQDPSSPYSGVISIFLDRASRGAPITVFGDGEQTRDFVYVTDVAAALAAALTRGTGTAAEMEVHNVGRGVQVSLLELLEQIGQLAGIAPLDVSFGPARQGDIVRSVADASRLMATGWRPRVSLQEGLARTLDDLTGTER